MRRGFATPKSASWRTKGGFAPILILIIVAVSIIGAVVYEQIKPKTTTPNSSTPLGPQTDAFFDRALESLFNGPPPTGPMSASTLSPCDLNADGKCDDADLNLFKHALGTRRGERGYSPLADLDADGVVTAIDEQMLLQVLDQNLSADAANWKTYTNSSFSFSLKYPTNWKIEEDTPIKPDIVIYSPDNSSNLIISPISEARYTTMRNRDKKLPNSAIILFAGRSSREYREDFSDKFQTVFVRDIQIEDIDGLNWTKPNEISYWVDKSKPDLLTTFDQILSTFKFLD